ncbi:MAG: hypothetical protein GWN00_22855, partial [Aliifodinibius sp.]|nr:hypothetical protein [candidate division Zixibacteria bacterium]NIT58957.1 hypothetical protein [Fodinibius sp.]NIW46609.1 hypothetical protein [Gammaproteobacteria bacterium]NIR65521.1 hypothetical protein [candidate division Zixibacteria bacterium]NIS47345.1 hypothetical protein [candidate division Zixibacteria bacterium]
NANDVAEEIVVDQGDNLIVVGTSLSSDFPLLNPIQPASGGSSDAFISKISADNQLMFSTYLGGSNSDSGLELALDPNGDFFLTGYSNSSDFPVASTSIPQPPTNPINGNAYATKISGDGSGILFST